ncbi:hypothetical protein C0Q44_18190 [Paenibacillus sp. PCH8]|nr:hypothetical protein C0Q44_18190 [Paenibacillus sp. PCH8]
MNYRNPVIAGYLSAIPGPSTGMPTCWTMRRLPCSRASASGFTSVCLGLRASGNGTENASPAYYEGFYYSNTKGDAL